MWVLPDWDRHAFGTGPFMVSRWIPGSALLLVPNPYYYGGKIHLAGIDMSFVPERLAAYKVPERIEFLPKLPLGPVGKVDRQALPARAGSA